jgi:hypothetical protein
LRRLALATCCSFTGAWTAIAAADQTNVQAIDEIVVFGRAQEQLGSALSASEGLVGYDDLRLAPMLRVGELVETVPGMVATQHSGTGKANQYFLRGFNLDHGTDFAASADGVPLNLRTHGHGHGYLDLSFLIPELVATSRYRKGPYSARVGDFSSAGSVEFGFYDRLEEAIVSATVGGFDYYRGLAAGSLDTASGVLTGAVDVTRYDGPWDLEENLRQDKFHVRYASELAGGTGRLALQGYEGRWAATDQVPRRAVTSGRIGALGFIDPDLGGESQRYSLMGTLDFERWTATAYVIDYELALFSNFTYFLDDPVGSDEFEQADDRTVWGGTVTGEFDRSLAGRPATFRWGAALRYDDIDEVGLYGTDRRVRNATVRRDRVQELSVGSWGEVEIRLSERLRAIPALRADWYDWDVYAFQAENSGSGNDRILSPKLGFAYRFGEGLEGYANWGRSFHSNDVRGATIVTDPVSGDPVDPVPPLVRSEGGELGLRYETRERFNFTLAAFWLALDSELVFVGDAGTTEPNDATERYGIELAGFWRVADWLAVHAAYTGTEARFRADQGGGREIPGAVASTFSLGLDGAWRNGMSASLRLRYLGDAPLTEDDSVRSDESLLVNAGLSWRRRNVELRADAFNLFDSDDQDIAYFYRSRLPEEPAEGIEDIHYHPLEPRTLRASVSVYWE